ncbi:ATP-grasp domain-containing protein [Paraburkholderia caballeronis]|uniref:ATP-grasp domain-containing protein n=1 Tax=Paraburkholderia caballeronis TaxID=416943 RepID=UPI001064CF01|nr:ATP-grasp domain-containing protein [Paraburkholderia caballeronis]TDV19551.1 putative ATP-grasp superfamily ATP-dependent carboligase [Paraburkholderia caballeronis]TDV22151.1 putative ATP-grasp superfamily ATP-dependent carboligase [Paraburkholderia caballeronis]TDV29055.1 putative ATP-grasp superfamily ATP-dependent carboligase [Paraburkholderia caballeronis]TDV39307.1 putative ATP-grasp superfamily ATP-dependent carboligase [Paraburkholderia caballeronis]
MVARTQAAGAPFVAIAGLSARLFAQSARRAGWRVAALDRFGDRDTRDASQCWFDIGDAGLSIDRERLIEALTRVARLPKLIGWIGVGGVEPFVADLASMRGLPPYLGNEAAASAAVREPRRFFALLDELGIAHPPVSDTPPSAPDGWLYKLADGCGGVHVREAARVLASGETLTDGKGYFQQRRPGLAMSALFVAARGDARVIGFSEQTSCAYGDMPFIHTGAIGPLDPPPRTAERIADAIRAIVARTGLVGINSFDFLLGQDDGSFELLEVNARPSSTLAIYDNAWPHAWPRGLLACHVEACVRGALPPPSPRAADARARVAQEVLFSPCPFAVSAAFSDACAHDPGCADVPMPGTRVATGDPVCTLVARAPELTALRGALDAARERVLQRLSLCHEPAHVFAE